MLYCTYAGSMCMPCYAATSTLVSRTVRSRPIVGVTAAELLYGAQPVQPMQHARHTLLSWHAFWRWLGMHQKCGNNRPAGQVRQTLSRKLPDWQAGIVKPSATRQQVHNQADQIRDRFARSFASCQQSTIRSTLVADMSENMLTSLWHSMMLQSLTSFM